LFVSDTCFPQTIELLQTRAEPLGIHILIGDWKSVQWDGSIFGAVIQ